MSHASTGLSVAIIARDDADALQRTIQSVKDLADEIIVLDTGSVDASRGQTRQLGATVVGFSWCDDFSAARNACLPHVNRSWVLWLDADETLDPSEVAKFREFLASEADPAIAYALLIRVPASSHSAAAEQIARIRLVPNNPAIQFIGRVRETMEPSLEAAGLTVQGLPYRIYRGMREHEADRKVARAQRNIHLAELDIKERGQLPRLLNCLGDAFQTLDRNQEAVQFFRRAVETSEPSSVDRLEAYYGLLTSLDGDDHRKEQLDVSVEANELFPLDAQLLCAMGGYLQIVGQPDVAVKCYENAFRFGQIIPTVWHVGEVREIAAICFSITLQMQEKLDAAEDVLNEALTASVPSPRVRRHLIELLVKRSKCDEALEQVRRLPRDTPHREALRSAVRGACLAAKQNWIAAKAYLKTAHTAGCRDAICLRWLALTLLASGEIAEALQIIGQWRLAEPGNAEAVKLQEAALQESAVQGGEPEALPRQWRVDAPGTSSVSNAGVERRSAAKLDPLGE